MSKMKGTYSGTIYTIPDHVAFGGDKNKTHNYFQFSNGKIHQLNHLYVVDNKRYEKLVKGYAYKASCSGYFDDCPFLIKSDEYVKPNGSKLNHSDLNKATRKVSVNKLIIS